MLGGGAPDRQDVGFDVVGQHGPNFIDLRLDGISGPGASSIFGSN
jgi:hypothetical protein